MNYAELKQNAEALYNLILEKKTEKVTDEKTISKLQQFIGNVAEYRGFNWPMKEVHIEKVHGWNRVFEVFERAQTPYVVFETGRCDAEKNSLSVENVEGTILNYAVMMNSTRWLTLSRENLEPLINYGSACLDKLGEMDTNYSRRNELIPNEVTNHAAEILMNMWNIEDYDILKLLIAPATAKSDMVSYALEHKSILNKGEDGLKEEIKKSKSKKDGYKGNPRFINDIRQLNKIIERNEYFIERLRDGTLQKETFINIGVVYETKGKRHYVKFIAEPETKVPDTADYMVLMESVDEQFIPKL